jgi:dTDP-4-dehydrorhamnose 3,5-epimerase-like enzyme
MTRRPEVSVVQLPDSGDHRGSSFTLPPEALSFVGTVRDIHFASLVPGSVRGNHFHLRRREAILVTYDSAWSLYWDNGEASQIQQREFTGSGAVLILVESGCSHAVRNIGDTTMRITGISSEVYDPSETVRREIT